MKVMLGEKKGFNISVKKFVFKLRDKENSDEKIQKSILRRVDKIADLVFYEGLFIISTIEIPTIEKYISFDVFIKENDVILFHIENFKIEDNLLRKTVFNFLIKTFNTLFKKESISVKNFDKKGWEKVRVFIVNNSYLFEKKERKVN